MNRVTTMRKMLLSLAVLLGAVGCSSSPPLAETPPLEVIVAKPVRKIVPDWDVYTGTMEAMKTVNVYSRVDGHIKAVLFKEGEEIKKGQELFQIDDEPFKAAKTRAEGQLKMWKAKLQLAEEGLKRYDQLYNKGSASKADLDQAQAAKGEALGGIDVANAALKEADLNIDYSKIDADINGKVGEALVTEGNYVKSMGNQNLLTTLRAVDAIKVVFYVPESAERRYNEFLREQAEKQKQAEAPAFLSASTVGLLGSPLGQGSFLAASALIPGKAQAEGNPKNGKPKPIPVEVATINDKDKFPYKGYVYFADNTLDPGTGSYRVFARIENPMGPGNQRPLIPGLFARVKVSIGDPAPALIVPDRAILTDQSLKYVLVVNKAKNNVVERVDVTLAPREQEKGWAVVKKGLSGDEWVIVDGVNRVRPGVSVKPVEAPTGK
jgi:multidrug efflux pump subunit AcrA (membrane-fusion protein)